ncbi:MAG TPA: response regulator [Gemmatimonadales bacterium]|nr:response regulator [Gemmatimonadales bacterium]
MIVLIVDDEAVSRRVLRRLLSRFPQLELHEAGNGQVAWEMLGTTEPALILCDLLMPVMDGVTLIRKLREHPVLKSVPVIVTSASKDRDMVLELKDLSLTDYLLKPFDLVQTFARLEKHIAPLLRRHLAAKAAEAEAAAAPAPVRVFTPPPTA